jgi:2-polyprenyl-3-methyl-5-hydroxy-6-metoxy-1,4-benzoquinol methylase
LTINGDGETLPLKSKSFDVVICMDTLEHIKHDSKVIKELFRILQPGGFAFISVPSLQILWSKHDVSVGHFRRYEKKQLISLFEKEAFQVLQKQHLQLN